MLAIRPITAADQAAWLPLWQGYQRFYQAQIAAETSALTWQRFLDPAEPMHAALAWRGEEAVGLVHFIFHRSCWTHGDYCYLQDLFVAADQRGGGIGRALIEHVYAEAAAAGASQVHWLTQESNYQGRMLYDRLAERSGFIQYRKLIQ
ncbi:MAG: GNAT family N-acetyltransferase [Pseudomonadaceae bacterium]|nr:GNAT family N-acetyltransferase [Pseudomonadaceae bacterium]